MPKVRLATVLKWGECVVRDRGRRRHERVRLQPRPQTHAGAVPTGQVGKVGQEEFVILFCF